MQLVLNSSGHRLVCRALIGQCSCAILLVGFCNPQASLTLGDVVVRLHSGLGTEANYLVTDVMKFEVSIGNHISAV